MPLIKSGSRAAVGTNIAEMEAADHPHSQAVAAALNNARRYGAKMANGGPSWTARASERELLHEGFINSAVPGRTDKLPISVEGGAYVVPSQHVAALGQDNSTAGAAILDKMFRQGPYGSRPMGLHPMRAAMPHLNLGVRGAPHFAPGGVPAGKPVKIVAAGGEYVISPRAILEKYGDLDKGHKALDRWIMNRRHKHAKTIAKLAPPKKD